MKPAAVSVAPGSAPGVARVARPPGYSAVGDQYGLLGLQSTILNGTAAALGSAAGGSGFAGATAGASGVSAAPHHHHHHPPPTAADAANLSTIIRGFDLNALGLSLTQQDPLHVTFSSPWSDAPQKIQPDFRLPSCYFAQPPHLKFAMFQKFDIDTLFYIFYSMPRDVLQLAASRELQTREWRFHRELKCWLQRTPGTELTQKTPTYERGSFTLFNVDKWQKEKRDDFTLVLAELEEVETTMQTAQQQHQAQQQQQQA